MIRIFLVAVAMAVLVSPAAARVEKYPASFKTEEVAVNGATIYVRVGGQGPAILMLHGFGDTGDMWQPLAVALMKTHTIVVPDLRGMGLSSHPDGGYDKKSQAQDLARLLDHFKIGKVALVSHDIGNMVAYAFAAQFPDKVSRWAVIDAPLPGIGEIWQQQLLSPKTWHFHFRGPDVERLVAGRERILLDRFYNELSANPAAIDEETRAHYAALYARPKAMHDAFEQFAAFPQDGKDNQAFLAKGKLTMLVFAIGGEKSYGLVMKDDLDQVATNVKGGVVKDSGHWIMDEQPAETVKLLVPFLEQP